MSLTTTATIQIHPLIDTNLKMDRQKKNILIKAFRQWIHAYTIAFFIFAAVLIIVFISVFLGISQSRADSNKWIPYGIALSAGLIGLVCTIPFFVFTYKLKKIILNSVLFFPESFRDEKIFDRFYDAKSKGKNAQIGYFSTRHMIDYLEVYDPYEDSTNKSRRI